MGLLGDMFRSIGDMLDGNRESAKTSIVKPSDGRGHKISQYSMVDIGGYKSPSGGYANYAVFSMDVINPKTGRKNTNKIYEAKDETEAREKAKADGFEDIIEVRVIPFPDPTDSQVNYARDLGIKYPGDVSTIDLSAILSRHLDEDPNSPSPGFVKFAEKYGFHFSRFIGEESLLGKVTYSLPIPEKIALYAYCVMHQEKKLKVFDPFSMGNWDKLVKFGEELSKDEKVTDSLLGRTVSDFRNPHKGTHIYKTVHPKLQNLL